MSLYDLFVAGAQHTIEWLLSAVGIPTAQQAEAALNNRFGPGSAVPPVPRLILSETANAVGAAGQLIAGVNPAQILYGINPAAAEQYAYTVIGQITNPLDPSRTIDVPWTVTSPTALTHNELVEQAQRELAEYRVRPDTGPGTQSTDMIRRDVRFQQAREARVNAGELAEITVVAAYSKS